VVARNVRWARTQGIRSLIEEHELHPVGRAITATRKARWRRDHGVAPGDAIPVFLFGLPRSGTNMMVRGLDVSPQFEVYNDGDGAAFHRHRLCGDETVRRLVSESRHRFVLFKPILDGHRIVELLDDLGTARPPKALWAYRDVDGRARSALKKFGPAAFIALRDIAAGTGEQRWQAQGLSEESLDLIRGVDWQRASAADGAALLWYVHNRRFFELGLDTRRDVLPVSYDAMVRAPERSMRTVCRFLGIPWDPGLAARIDDRSLSRRERLALDPRIRSLCEDLAGQLDAATEAASARLDDGPPPSDDPRQDP
jgi:hypothetical protein